jgi:hypothetical protein
MSRQAPILLALLTLAGCTGWPSSIALPGGPLRGTMTHDEAMAARTGLTRLDRVAPAEASR